jgi:hypothetical protein
MAFVRKGTKDNKARQADGNPSWPRAKHECKVGGHDRPFAIGHEAYSIREPQALGRWWQKSIATSDR